LDDHPGGGDLILEYGGKDVSEIMGDEISHAHSEAAYEILDEHLVGFVATDKILETATKSGHPDDILPLPPNMDGAQEMMKNGVRPPVYATTGMSSAEDLSKETDATTDYRTHQFLDLNRPLLVQVWRGGFSKEFYLEQVHRPRHYKGGESAPLFGNFLEPLSKTPWWVVPMVWLPPVIYTTYMSREGLTSWGHVASFWMTGLFLWTLVEYTLHRGLFHIDGYVKPSPINHSYGSVCLSIRRLDISLITVLESRFTSCYTASTTIYPWTSYGWLCRPLSS
jgi:4-hydroxysphinganine ceramide fatty acyl 2-hydroxylase